MLAYVGGYRAVGDIPQHPIKGWNYLLLTYRKREVKERLLTLPLLLLTPYSLLQAFGRGSSGALSIWPTWFLFPTSECSPHLSFTTTYLTSLTRLTNQQNTSTNALVQELRLWKRYLSLLSVSVTYWHWTNTYITNDAPWVRSEEKESKERIEWWEEQNWYEAL